MIGDVGIDIHEFNWVVDMSEIFGEENDIAEDDVDLDCFNSFSGYEYNHSLKRAV